VAIDQGGCFETSRPTTHSEPVYEIDGIIHYAVANIPGAVPNTSTMALTNATLKYALALADKGWQQACREDPALYRGLNIVEGKVTFKAVADAFGLLFDPVVLCTVLSFPKLPPHALPQFVGQRMAVHEYISGI
jgi:alanine dehydrogenase